MTYREALEYLDSLGSRGWIFGLSGIRGILSKIGNPERKLNVVHVAGTNGKGSTCAFISKVLEAHGYKVGTYTSPHILSFRERIQVNGKKIGREEVAEYVRDIRSSLNGHDSFTYFDFTTAMAFKYFSDVGVDIAVVEVGLGGRLDSTNVVDPLVSVITKISYDHTDVLGDTLEKIASEKAGIIKKGRPVVSAVQSEEARDVVIRKALEMGSPIYFAGYKRGDMFTEGSLRNARYVGRKAHIKGITIPLSGFFQLENLAVSLAALEAMGFELSEDKVKKGVSLVKLPGRLEKLKRGGRLIVFDVSHNEDGVRTLISNISSHAPFIVVLGVMKDKNWKGILDLLRPLASEFVYIKLPTSRGEDPENLARYKRGKVFKDPELAASYIVEREGNALITGSFYTVSEMKRAFMKICSGG